MPWKLWLTIWARKMSWSVLLGCCLESCLSIGKWTTSIPFLQCCILSDCDNKCWKSACYSMIQWFSTANPQKNLSTYNKHDSYDFFNTNLCDFPKVKSLKHFALNTTITHIYTLCKPIFNNYCNNFLSQLKGDELLVVNGN